MLSYDIPETAKTSVHGNIDIRGVTRRATTCHCKSAYGSILNVVYAKEKSNIGGCSKEILPRRAFRVLPLSSSESYSSKSYVDAMLSAMHSI